MDILRFDGARPTWFVAHSDASSEIASLHCSHWFSNPDPDLSSYRRLRSHGESFGVHGSIEKSLGCNAEVRDASAYSYEFGKWMRVRRFQDVGLVDPG